VNDAGEIAFLWNLAGPGIVGVSERVLWSDGGRAGLAVVAREGEPAPGVQDGALFQNIETPVLNGAGQTAFRGRLEGPGVDASNLVGIWSEGGGEGLSLVARSGDPAPGAESGAVFTGLFEPFLNAAGQTAFMANAAIPGETPRIGIWAEHPSGELVQVAGGLLDVDDGPGSDLREIVQLSLAAFPRSGGQDGRKRALNSRGQVAFRAAFTDRTAGVFVFKPDPAVEITSPADGESVEADEILVQGVASDDGEVVSVVVNGIAADLVPTGNAAEVLFSVTIPLVPGENLILATATDDEGNAYESNLVVERQPQAGPLECDANQDGSVDRLDIAAIFTARGTAASGPDDPRDVNRDGLITINDGRLCVLECTNPSCAPTVP
jgi:hypothetical protein